MLSGQLSSLDYARMATRQLIKDFEREDLTNQRLIRLFPSTFPMHVPSIPLCDFYDSVSPREILAAAWGYRPPGAKV
jgi:hypothetical protein